jgi:dolichyl-diphosphooligosaccharide--protein glycosyltransferase
LRHRYDATELYITVWGGFIVSAAFTQVRFNYYLAAVVAVFNAIFIAQAADVIDIRETTYSVRASAEELEGWQIIGAVTIMFLVVAPFLFGGISGLNFQEGGVGALDAGDPDRVRPGAVEIWDDELEWMNENTPAPGKLERPDDEAIDPTGTYKTPPDGDYNYSEGAYGVQSWWDYGHWITVHGDRIPNANPFQDGATEAANYLLAPNETAAEDALSEQMNDNGETRYVMIDSQMANTNDKFAAPTVFNNAVSFSDFINTVVSTQTRQPQQVRIRTQRYYESQMTKLYSYHGSAAEPAPVVLDPQQQTFQTRDGGQTTIRTVGQGYQTFATLESAKSYVAENPGAILGGIGSLPRERVDALNHYRLIKSHQSTSRRYIRNVRRAQQLTNASSFRALRNAPSWVKTFEKVPGATVEGSGAPPETEVKATVDMRIPSNGRTFSYTQYATTDENGEFEMTLPYSTAGYENFGPTNGYTNVSVRANGTYRFRTVDDSGSLYTDTNVTVTESQVVGAVDESVRVQLTETQPVQSSSQSVQIAG